MNPMDPNHPIVKLCVAGMQAESQGKPEQALRLFTQAWALAADDFEACIAAHYVARHQANPQDTLRWNLEALRRAEAVGDERVRDFYPSLYLNMGHSYELVGEPAEARRYYDLAAASVEDLPEDRYGGVVRGGISVGRKRVNETQE